MELTAVIALVALFLFHTPSIVEGQARTTPGVTTGIDYTGECSPAILKGTYGFLEQGTVVAQLPGFPPPPFDVAISGIGIYDGAENLSGTFKASYNGLVVPGTFTGRYALTANKCIYTDEIALSIFGIAVHRAGTISGLGVFRELNYASTAGGFIAYGTVKRILREPCSLATLKGTYTASDQGTGTTGIPGFRPPHFPAAHSGHVTFDGAGRLSGEHTGSLDGVITAQAFTGTYAVNPDCTLSAEVTLPDGHVLHEAGTITGMGIYQEVHIITDAGWRFADALRERR